MAIQYHIATIPVIDPAAATAQLNMFLRGHQVVSVQKELVRHQEGAYWAFVVEVVTEGSGGPGGPPTAKVDYRNVLTPEDFALFAKLRDIRKKIAEGKGLPVFAVCTNDQLAQIAREKPQSSADLRKIPGIGEGKGALVAEAFLAVLVPGLPASPL